MQSTVLVPVFVDQRFGSDPKTNPVKIKFFNILYLGDEMLKQAFFLDEEKVAVFTS
jgi:hypothetical protein